MGKRRGMGRRYRTLVRLLNNGELTHLTSPEIVKVLRVKPSVEKRFSPWITLSAVEQDDLLPLIAARPDLVDALPKESVAKIDPGDLLMARIDYIDKIPAERLATVDSSIWVMLACIDVSIIHKIPRTVNNLSALVAAGFGSCPGLSNFSGLIWRKAILANPQCFKYCDLNKLSKADWAALYPVREKIKVSSSDF